MDISSILGLRKKNLKILTAQMKNLTQQVQLYISENPDKNAPGIYIFSWLIHLLINVYQ